MSRNHMKRVRVAADRWNFETSDGAFITPLGGNILNDQHPGRGRCLTTSTRPTAIGGYIGGNDWFDVERLADSGRQLDWDCTFWSAFTGHYKDHPAIWAWDLRNELLYWTRAHMVAPGSTEEQKVEAMLKDTWPWWLETRYGTVAAMNKAYG